MASTKKTKGALSVRAYIGDAKTLLAFNMPKAATKNLAGFTIQVKPGAGDPYYILNSLQYKNPAAHAQDAILPANSTFNAPIHKFRWVHVPGSAHQGVEPFYGDYLYTVTPRYFDGHGSMLAIDPALGVPLTVEVGPFSRKHLDLGFTRGFTQSQAFVRHFGVNALIRPKTKDLLFDTSAQSGVSPLGQPYTFADEYKWLGFTARDRIFTLLESVLAKTSLRLDVFAYDLNEPDLIDVLLTLATQGRVRVILDNASLHHGTPPKYEDQFETLFTNAAKGDAAILRGRFGRYSHDKVFVVKTGAAPETALRVLTGSTNFSVTGLYVNSNHVLVFNNAKVAQLYAKVFDEAWKDGVKAPAFRQSPLSTQTFSFGSAQTPAVDITFSPHTDADVTNVLDGVAARIASEGKQGKTTGSVLFAVMEMDSGQSPVFTALKALHANTDIFSYGISDNPGGIYLYRPNSRQGVLVTGKPIKTTLPPPFNQVPNIGGVGHQVHHKFVVCGFNGDDPVVYCGSSNLASGGENLNGDNLLAIRDVHVATVFAIEAIALVDHFDFLDRTQSPTPKASKSQAAVDAGWFLSTTDKWVAPYYNPDDLRSVDRQLFA